MLPLHAPTLQSRSWWRPIGSKGVLLMILSLAVLGVLSQLHSALRVRTLDNMRWPKLKLEYPGSGMDREVDRPSCTLGSSMLPNVGWDVGPAVRFSWDSADQVTETKIISHVDGFTVFENLYFRNGTLFIVTDDPSSIPSLETITSVGHDIVNGDEAKETRKPTAKEIRVIDKEAAIATIGTSASPVGGVTWLVTNSRQYYGHYYHFTAEWLLAMWRTHSSAFAQEGASPPLPQRLVLPHMNSGEWRDYAHLNEFVFRAAFPSAGIETREDWRGRGESRETWYWPRVVLSDRAAAFRSDIYQSTNRYAATAFSLPASESWFEPLRSSVIDFAGGNSTISHPPVITYISRQSWGRRSLRKEDHSVLVAALMELKANHGYEVNVVEMETLTAAEQIQISSRTTILMGVHGNGLTALTWMKPSARSTVMEFFTPGGFLSDYGWTAKALGHAYYGWWDKGRFTDFPEPAIPEGFHGSDIPIDGRAVADLCRKILQDL